MIDDLAAVLRKTLVLAGLVLVLAGCSSGEVKAGIGTRTSTPPPTTSRKSHIPKPADLSQFLPTDEALAPTGFAVEDQPRSTISVVYPKKLIVACENEAMESWDKAVVEGSSAGWFKMGGGANPALTSETVDERMGRYDGVTGAQVVAQIKAAMACGTFTETAEDFKVDEKFTAPALPGVDAQYGFCGAATDTPDVRKCVLFLAHGDRAEVLESTEINDEGLKPGKAKKSLLTTLPMFAAAFAKDR